MLSMSFGSDMSVSTDSMRDPSIFWVFPQAEERASIGTMTAYLAPERAVERFTELLLAAVAWCRGEPPRPRPSGEGGRSRQGQFLRPQERRRQSRPRLAGAPIWILVRA